VAVTAPLGQYDDDGLVNIGTLELAAGATVFTRNDDFPPTSRAGGRPSMGSGTTTAGTTSASAPP